jgi:Tfp pilus assembly protein PilN
MEQQRYSLLQEQQVAENMPEEINIDSELEELKQLLPGLPVGRLKKIRQAYQENLSDPSMLTLVPILREKMPVSTLVADSF